MADCCDPGAYRREFDPKGADRLARTYRGHGLGGTARGLVDFLRSRGVDGMTVLEVGGGVGEIQIELLLAGAARSVDVELSDGYEGVAAELLAENGLVDRVERRLGDFVTEAEAIQPADIVVLNRVICCYPWMAPMVDAAAAKTRRFLAIALPRDHLLSRLLVRGENVLHRIRRPGFRAFVHPISAVKERLSAAGLEPVHSATTLLWQELVFERV